MNFDVLTLFPDIFDSFIEEGVLGRAVAQNLIRFGTVNIRNFTDDLHRTTDDRPFGGGDGMVMKPEPIVRALNSVERVDGRSLVILLCPQGDKWNQQMAWELSSLDQIILVCGRYEGVDERIRDSFIDRAISIGDYILSGGEPAAMVVMDSVARLVPGVLGGQNSSLEDTFEGSLIKYPQYTRPREFQGFAVPDVLLSGDHEKIRRWRRARSLKRTLEKRPDLFEKAELSEEDKKLLDDLREQEAS